jgi:hypothetical protein
LLAVSNNWGAVQRSRLFYFVVDEIITHLYYPYRLYLLHLLLDLLDHFHHL